MGTLVRDSVPGVFPGSRLVTQVPSPTLSGKKQVFRINCAVCIKSLGMVNRYYERMVQTLLKSKVPDARQAGASLASKLF